MFLLGFGLGGDTMLLVNMHFSIIPKGATQLNVLDRDSFMCRYKKLVNILLIYQIHHFQTS